MLQEFSAETRRFFLCNLLCYVRYYQLSASAAFLDGMVPLAAAALLMAGMDVALLAGRG